MLAVVFIIGSSALLGLGNLFVHAYGAAVICLVLTGLGLTSMIMNVVLHRGGN
jgi:hypothetical protein